MMDANAHLIEPRMQRQLHIRTPKASCGSHVLSLLQKLTTGSAGGIWWDALRGRGKLPANSCDVGHHEKEGRNVIIVNAGAGLPRPPAWSTQEHERGREMSRGRLGFKGAEASCGCCHPESSTCLEVIFRSAGSPLHSCSHVAMASSPDAPCSLNRSRKACVGREPCCREADPESGHVVAPRCVAARSIQHRPVGSGCAESLCKLTSQGWFSTGYFHEVVLRKIFHGNLKTSF